MVAGGCYGSLCMLTGNNRPIELVSAYLEQHGTKQVHQLRARSLYNARRADLPSTMSASGLLLLCMITLGSASTTVSSTQVAPTTGNSTAYYPKRQLTPQQLDQEAAAALMTTALTCTTAISFKRAMIASSATNGMIPLIRESALRSVATLI